MMLIIFSFSLFCLIHSFHISVTIVRSYNILWYNKSKTTRLTQRRVQYFLSIVYGLKEFIVSV